MEINNKILNYIKQIQNPYILKEKNMAVRFEYSENGKKFEDIFMEIILSKNAVDAEHEK